MVFLRIPMGRNRPTVRGIVSEHNTSKITANAEALKVQHRELDNISHRCPVLANHLAVGHRPNWNTLYHFVYFLLHCKCKYVLHFLAPLLKTSIPVLCFDSYLKTLQFIIVHFIMNSSIILIYLHSFHLIGMEINVVGERHTLNKRNTNKRESFQK